MFPPEKTPYRFIIVNYLAADPLVHRYLVLVLPRAKVLEARPGGAGTDGSRLGLKSQSEILPTTEALSATFQENGTGALN